MTKIEWKSFERERNTTKGRVLGTGLGLAVVKGFVDMMGGDIRVDSQVGRGSRFTVNLMLRLAENAVSYEEPQEVPLLDDEQLKGLRILLVDDNEINQEIAVELLLEQGYQVDVAADGQSAVDMIAASAPGYYSLVLMDIQMPVMDGHEATRQIRALPDPRLAGIPIIALSANVFAEDQKKSLDAGMNAHLPKPIDIDSLQELIRQILSTGRDKNEQT